MFQMNYPFAKLPLFKAFVDYINEFKPSIDTLSLVDIQNLMVAPGGELYDYLLSFSDELIDFRDNMFKKNFNEELTALTSDILACETSTEARALLNNELNDLSSIVGQFRQVFMVNGLDETISILSTLKSLSELKLSSFGDDADMAQRTFNIFLQLGYLEELIVGGTLHVPVSLIEILNNSKYPSLHGNSITDCCVEIEITKLIQYAIQNQEFTL